MKKKEEGCLAVRQIPPLQLFNLQPYSTTGSAFSYAEQGK